MPGGDRKYGRHARSPAQKRYNAEARWNKNAKRRQARHLKALEPQTTTVPRGTTRRTRRSHMTELDFQNKRTQVTREKDAKHILWGRVLSQLNQ